MRVHAPLAGNHPIGIADLVGKLHIINHNLHARFQLGTRQQQHAAAHAARRACARAAGDVFACVAPDNLGKVRQIGIQRTHHLRCCAFLRRKHGSRAFFATQRVVHIASHFQRNLLQPRIQAGKIRPRQLRQTAAAVADGCAVFIQQIRAQCLQHPRAAIVGGAATNAEQDFFHAVV